MWLRIFKWAEKHGNNGIEELEEVSSPYKVGMGH